MKDFILREIDKMGTVIEAILLKIGILKRENKSNYLIEIAKLELLKNLNIDIDQLLQDEQFVEILIQEYRFNNNNLEKFAELLFDFIETANNMDEKKKLISSICKIYSSLEGKKYPISFNMFYILKELKRYSDGLID
jgi:hypothetical protein